MNQIMLVVGLLSNVSVLILECLTKGILQYSISKLDRYGNHDSIQIANK